MNLLFRTIVFVAMAVVTIGGCFLFSSPSTNPKAGVVVWLPEEIPGYISEETVMSLEEKKWLPEGTTYWSMNYREKELPDSLSKFRSLSATSLVAGTDSRSLHRPQVCLRA